MTGSKVMLPFKPSLLASQPQRQKRLFLFLMLIGLLAGCTTSAPLSRAASGDSGPASIVETSRESYSLQYKIRLIEQYVTFKRNYEALEYNLMYQNNGGFLPGPSDWDIQILAIVPSSEVAEWIPEGVDVSEQQPPEWVNTIPGNIPTEGLREWYIQSGKVVGIDRAHSIIACRYSTL